MRAFEKKFCVSESQTVTPLQNNNVCVLQWLAKLLLLNLSVGLMILVMRYVMTEALWFEILLLVLCNIVFLVYDFALTRLLAAYVRVWRKKLR